MGSSVIGKRDGLPVVLPKSHRETHMHVIGASGSGKSYFLEHLIRRDIVAGRGVCVIDPHGELYDNLVNWMVRKDIRVHQLHLINLSDSDSAVGFNPLCLTDRNPMRRASDMIAAFERVWGQDMSETPRLSKCLRMTLYPLAVHNLSLLEANAFTAYTNKHVRDPLLMGLPNTPEGEAVRQEWFEFEEYDAKDFRNYFESTRTRIFEFTSAPSIAPIIGQTENVLDFRHCMDNGHVVLVNLKTEKAVHEKEAQVFGALVAAEMFAAAKQRDVQAAKYRPFYAYIDECADYLNSDIARSLDQTRKFGLHYILSHQRLGQLRDAGAGIHDAVTVNAQTKVVFRLGDEETSEFFAKQLFRSSFDLEMPKESMNKPVAVGQELIELYSEAESSAVAETTMSSSGAGESSSSGESVFVPLDLSERGMTESAGLGTSSFSGSASGSSQSQSHVHGRHQSLRTIYEIMPTALYSIDEQVHLAMVAIQDLPPRNAIVKLSGMRPVRMGTIDVTQSEALSVQLDMFKRFAHERSYYSLPVERVKEKIRERRELIFEDSAIEYDTDYDPDNFVG